MLQRGMHVGSTTWFRPRCSAQGWQRLRASAVGLRWMHACAAVVRPSSPPLFFRRFWWGFFLRSHQLTLTVCCAPFFNGWISRSATPGRTAPRRLDEDQQLQNNTLAAPLSRPTALGRRENWSRGCLEMHAPHCTAPHRTSPLRLSNPFFWRVRLLPACGSAS